MIEKLHLFVFSEEFKKKVEKVFVTLSIVSFILHLTLILINKVGNKTMKKEFFCNITDPNLLIKKKKTDINSGKLGISKKEVRKIYRKSLNEAIEKKKYLVHSNPNNFILDEKTVTHNPFGKKCNRLSLLSYNIFVNNFYIENLNSSFKKNKINITKFFESGIASSMSSLSIEEKNEGVVCIDIGGNTTKIVAYIENGDVGNLKILKDQKQITY